MKRYVFYAFKLVKFVFESLNFIQNFKYLMFPKEKFYGLVQKKLGHTLRDEKITNFQNLRQWSPPPRKKSLFSPKSIFFVYVLRSGFFFSINCLKGLRFTNHGVGFFLNVLGMVLGNIGFFYLLR